MSVLGRFALVVAGMLGASVASVVVGGCGGYFECNHIVRAVDPGTYALTTAAPRTEIGEDENYRIEVSADGKKVTETFTRNGRAHRNVYAGSEQSPSPLRTNRGVEDD